MHGHWFEYEDRWRQAVLQREAEQLYVVRLARKPASPTHPGTRHRLLRRGR
jgi:hypothetical protein